MLIIIAHGDFSQQHRTGSWFQFKIMVHILENGDALSWSQPYLGSRWYRMSPSITMHCHRRIRKFTLWCGIVYTDQHIAATPVDDVFHLIPVKMHGSHLTFFDIQKLLRIRLRILVFLLRISISQCDQRKSHFVKPPQTIICDIPSQHIVPDLIILMVHALPLLRCQIAKWRQRDPVLPDHGFHLF